MTDTSYLYEYFLAKSSDPKEEQGTDEKSEENEKDQDKK
jgi:hypothetical protein